MKQKSRTIFIGDIHGCYDEFRELLKKLSIKKHDTIYLTGDLIFKGPKSLKVLKYVYKHKDRFQFIQGNKEFELLRAIKSKKFYSSEEKKLAEKLKNKYPEVLKYLKKIPYYIEEKDFILVHAGIVPGKNIHEHDPHELCYLREYMGKPWYEYYTGRRKIIYGHRAIDGLKIRNNTIGLDSGCVYGGKLSAFILETEEIVQVAAQKLYKNPHKYGSLSYYTKQLGFKISKFFKGK